MKLPEQTCFESIKKEFAAVIKQDEGWRIGWIAEIAGVNSQGKTRADLVKNLRSALKEALKFNREDALASAKADYEEEPALVWNGGNLSSSHGLQRSSQRGVSNCRVTSNLSKSQRTYWGCTERSHNLHRALRQGVEKGLAVLLR